MIVQLGAEVRGPDGGKLGELHRIVFDTESEELVSVVVTHSSLDGREVVVPRSAITSSDDESVQLTVEEDQFDQFRDYERSVNVAPPREPDHPADAQNVVSDTVDDPLDVPDVLRVQDHPAIGAASGIESITYVPVIEESIQIRVGEQVLDRVTVVYATDGEVGRVKQVEFSDDSNRIVRLVVDSGFFFKHDTEIPYELVEKLLDESVILSVSKASIETSDASR